MICYLKSQDVRSSCNEHRTKPTSCPYCAFRTSVARRRPSFWSHNTSCVRGTAQIFVLLQRWFILSADAGCTERWKRCTSWGREDSCNRPPPPPPPPPVDVWCLHRNFSRRRAGLVSVLCVAVSILRSA